VHFYSHDLNPTRAEPGFGVSFVFYLWVHLKPEKTRNPKETQKTQNPKKTEKKTEKTPERRLWLRTPAATREPVPLLVCAAPGRV
jgi:hypothetical protein